MELILEGLTYAYEGCAALAGLDLRAGPGVTAVLGPNGSGKSTLLKLGATALRPDRGRILLGGRPYTGDLRPVRRALGYLPQELDLPGHLTPHRLLHYLAGLKQVAAEPQSRALLAELGLEAQADRPLAELSGGQLRRVGIAQALLGSPRLLLLDEPTRGLDPEERERVLHLLSRSARGRIILFSSHLAGDAEAVASRVLVLHRGRVLFTGSAERLRALAEGRVWEAAVPVEEAERWMRAGRVSRAVARGATALLRFVGAPPRGLDCTPAPARLEDGYLCLLEPSTPS
ncbi:MAG: ATP-binding cassette domain-containing protein [Bacillota bacterium]